MSGRTFEQLMKFFYLNDAEKQTNHTKDDYDMIYKIRQLLTLVVKAFQSVYVNNQELSADDSIIGYMNMDSWIQYMPNKTTKWGIKAWVLPDVKNSYVYNFKLYSDTSIPYYEQ